MSEVMLQQTQALRVVPKWMAFMEAFPTTASCAGASLGDVLRLWQGLGYPRRARNLHAAAHQVELLGGFPNTIDGLLALPGVGQYTARAVLAFAFGADAAVVDTNIARVLARVEGRRLTPREAQRLADDWSVPGSSWEWNQSVMELGAVLCRPTSPGCVECPLAQWCAWRGEGDDPAPGSAGVSRAQPRFDGSDRQARGRLLRALAASPLRADVAATVMQRDDSTSARLVAALIAEGLCVRDGDRLRLP